MKIRHLLTAAVIRAITTFSAEAQNAKTSFLDA